MKRLQLFVPRGRNAIALEPTPCPPDAYNFCYISDRAGEGKVVPAGSTYRIRHGEYYFRESRVFPSYLQAGLRHYIEESKRRMIAEDIAAALAIA